MATFALSIKVLAQSFPWVLRLLEGLQNVQAVVVEGPRGLCHAPFFCVLHQIFCRFQISAGSTDSTIALLLMGLVQAQPMLKQGINKHA